MTALLDGNVTAKGAAEDADRRQRPAASPDGKFSVSAGRTSTVFTMPSSRAARSVSCEYRRFHMRGWWSRNGCRSAAPVGDVGADDGPSGRRGSVSGRTLAALGRRGLTLGGLEVRLTTKVRPRPDGAEGAASIASVHNAEPQTTSLKQNRKQASFKSRAVCESVCVGVAESHQTTHTHTHTRDKTLVLHSSYWHV